MIDLLCIGAGAKSIAVAAKAHVLNEHRPGTLTVVVAERHEAAASWTGRGGYTSGSEMLGTRPEKDLGFPYRSRATFGTAFGDIDEAMSRFSWHSHARSTGALVDWVDRGSPPVTHEEFAGYLQSALGKTDAGVRVLPLGVRRLSLDGNAWTVELDDGSRIAAQNVLLTGPGRVAPLPGGVVDLPDAAHARPMFARGAPPSVVIVGGGESAASCARHILDRMDRDGRVTLVSSELFRMRDETFVANRLYSNPGRGWSTLTWDQRADFIRRTDRGVVSPPLFRALVADPRVRMVRGRVIRVESVGAQYAVHVGGRALRADAVVNCTGFRLAPLIRELLSEHGQAHLSAATSGQVDDAALSRLIDDDLALTALPARLFLPGLAGLRAGPGFANLSILGTLSDRILATVLRDRDARDAPLAFGGAHAVLR